jgi:hypothetical protein
MTEASQHPALRAGAGTLPCMLARARPGICAAGGPASDDPRDDSYAVG